MSKIDFIGAGVTGKSTVRNMVENSLSVNVYNRTRSKADDLTTEGAVWYGTPKAIAEANDVTFTTVGFSSNVEGVYFNGTGISQADFTDKVIIDLTTSMPTLAGKITKKAAETGVHVLSASVSGGDLGAKNDALIVMVGGDQGGYNTVLSVSKTFGEALMLRDSARKGQRTKMANQLMATGTMADLAEMLIHANAIGLTLEKALETVDDGSAADRSLSNCDPRTLKENYTPGFFIKHFIEDLKTVLDKAERLGLSLSATQKAIELYESLAGKGFEDDGTRTLTRFWWTDGKQPTNKN